MPARPLPAAEESWVVATDLAEALARAGTPFHQAHQIVGRFVLESVRSGKQARRLDARKRCGASRRNSRRRSAALLDPREGMQSREIAGRHGPGGGRRGAGAKRDSGSHEMNV